jgi:hypothetical protein
MLCFCLLMWLFFLQTLTVSILHVFDILVDYGCMYKVHEISMSNRQRQPATCLWRQFRFPELRLYCIFDSCKLCSYLFILTHALPPMSHVHLFKVQTPWTRLEKKGEKTEKFSVSSDERSKQTRRSISLWPSNRQLSVRKVSPTQST